MRLAILVAVLALAMPAAAEVHITDGDTFSIDGERIRLFGIDAPERDQPGGPEATQELRRIVGRATPRCEQIDVDRYGRTVALCAVAGADLSLAMVRAGWAVAWCYYLRRQRPALLGRFQGAETEAKAARRGMWVRPFRAWRDWGCR